MDNVEKRGSFSRKFLKMYLAIKITSKILQRLREIARNINSTALAS
jgi:hypothetical protein